MARATPFFAFAVAATMVAGGAASAGARVLMTQQQALDLAFPGCTVAR